MLKLDLDNPRAILRLPSQTHIALWKGDSIVIVDFVLVKPFSQHKINQKFLTANTSFRQPALGP